ncbi:hypothetical protein BOX15_Mlig019078g1 [Macrostomum lignano]|uniref:Uncharacterized protein n=2 Tax=Macrostomum lignano TaxID=282301 RepID=A0A267DTQ3_9PLAT|nr:hypothetical protein BOX15_Mlig019078g3 [Macrostomum lignano]PAA88098.1 hypothetical protein BOX15_Mlig019078g1 [Macrostomum lignano]
MEMLSTMTLQSNASQQAGCYIQATFNEVATKEVHKNAKAIELNPYKRLLCILTDSCIEHMDVFNDGTMGEIVNTWPFNANQMRFCRNGFALITEDHQLSLITSRGYRVKVVNDFEKASMGCNLWGIDLHEEEGYMYIGDNSSCTLWRRRFPKLDRIRSDKDFQFRYQNTSVEINHVMSFDASTIIVNDFGGGLFLHQSGTNEVSIINAGALGLDGFGGALCKDSEADIIFTIWPQRRLIYAFTLDKEKNFEVVGAGKHRMSRLTPVEMTFDCDNKYLYVLGRDEENDDKMFVTCFEVGYHMVGTARDSYIGQGFLEPSRSDRMSQFQISQDDVSRLYQQSLDTDSVDEFFV